MMLRRSFLMLAFAVASTRAISEDAASFQSFLDGTLAGCGGARHQADDLRGRFCRHNT